MNIRSLIITFSWKLSGPNFIEIVRYKYPLEENVKENAAEDARCLAMAEEAIEASQAR